MDVSNLIKITPSKPKQLTAGKPTGNSGSMSQNQLIGIGLIVFGVILIGVGIFLW
jgi:hypothetical protein